MKYFIGIDQGGTKTDVLIGDEASHGFVQSYKIIISQSGGQYEIIRNDS